MVIMDRAKMFIVPSLVNKVDEDTFQCLYELACPLNGPCEQHLLYFWSHLVKTRGKEQFQNCFRK